MKTRDSLLLVLSLLWADALPAQGCPLTSYGRTCGPLLTGSAQLDGKNRQIEMRLTGALPTAFGFTVFGDRATETRLGSTNCFLNTNPILINVFTTDGSGNAVHRTAVPYSVQLFVCVQDIVLRGSGTGLQLQSSNGLKAGPWFGVRTVLEDFSTTTQLDCSATSARWLGDGSLRTGRLGGNGCLGDFDVRFGGKNTNQRDAKGRAIWEWSTDRTVIPGSRTLNGEDIVVTNGVFQFRTFRLPNDVNLRFVGKNAPHILTTGLMRIDGALSNAGRDQLRARSPVRGRPPFDGQAGTAGGAGAGAGGHGGHSPHRSGGGSIHGRDGQPATAPAGHPLANELPLTPGKGSQANPSSGRDPNVTFSAYANSICQQGAAGGGGGGLATNGDGGKCVDNKTGSNSHPPVAADFGQPSVGGKPVSLNTLFNRAEKSSFLFLLGGAGGGGGGAHPHGAFDQRPRQTTWSPGGGGAGGGGPLHLRIGGDLQLLGEVLVNGGFAVTYPYDVVDFWNYAPGGAGSGGAALIQIGGQLTLLGPVDALGGAAGQMDSNANFDLRLDSLSGKGGDGYIRFEADPPIPIARLRTLRPPVTANNTALLRKVDTDFVTLAASEYYVTGFLPSVFHYYEIRAKIGTASVVFSDNMLISSQRASKGQPVVIFVQSAKVDSNGNEIAPPTKWYEGTMAPLNTDPNRGNGIRFLIELDRTKTPSGVPIQVEDVRFVFDC